MPNPRITIVDIRPNTSVPFYSQLTEAEAPGSTEWKAHINTTYRDTGLIVNIGDEEISEDQLTRSLVIEFRDVEAFAVFEQDPLQAAIIPIVQEYNDIHDIIRTITKGYI
jgi:hypothetical protein